MDPGRPVRILHLDASGRPGLRAMCPHGQHGSYSRRLSRHFVDCWLDAWPESEVEYRDLGAAPPKQVGPRWIQAVCDGGPLSPAQLDAVAESDLMVDELFWADMVVIGTPLYDLTMPSCLKAWLANVVHQSRTVPDDAENADPRRAFCERFFPVVVRSARGGHGMDEGGEFAHLNNLESSLRAALGRIGITEIHAIAVEHTAEGGQALLQSLASAISRMESLAAALLERCQRDQQRKTTVHP